MKRASSLILALVMATGMALAQTGGDKKSTELNPQPLPPGKVKAESKAKKGHKGGKKSKKGSSSGTTQTSTPPK